MTMPYLMNCSHSPDGWCLSCVKELAAQLEEARRGFAVLCGDLQSCQGQHEALLFSLKETHDAMVNWFSSEYAEHPIAKRARRAIDAAIAQQKEKDKDNG